MTLYGLARRHDVGPAGDAAARRLPDARMMIRLARHARTVALALALALPAAVAAQQAPDSAGMPPGTRLRLTMLDTSITFGRARHVGAAARVEGSLVSFGGREVVVRVARNQAGTDYTDYTIPFDNLRTLERRVAAGPCQRSTGARLLCVAGGMSIGATVGYFGGRQIGRAIGEDSSPAIRADSESKYGTRGLFLGAVVGALVFSTFGRDEWAPLWTNPNAEQ